MAEILLKAVDASNTNPAKDAMCYKKGYPVVVMPDGHEWGSAEGLPLFTLMKIPHVPVSEVKKYLDMDMSTDENGDPTPVGRRLWRIKWQQLPQATHDRLFVDGELVIKACETYTGPYDHTWEEVRSFLENQKTGTIEVGDLICGE